MLTRDSAILHYMLYDKRKISTKNQADLNKPVTVGLLLEYTNEFLIPKMVKIIDERLEEKLEQKLEQKLKTHFAGFEHRLKDYIDRKLTDHTAELFKRLDERYGREKQFKEKIVELFRKHKIGSSEDLAFLEGLVQGS